MAPVRSSARRSAGWPRTRRLWTVAARALPRRRAFGAWHDSKLLRRMRSLPTMQESDASDARAMTRSLRTAVRLPAGVATPGGHLLLIETESQYQREGLYPTCLV